jgi:site-specific DNA-adenine methylase
MWPYYGAKLSIVHKYSPPAFNKIIEPFAGAASYSLRYWQNDVTLVDKYPLIVKVWKWLQACSQADLKKLPRVEVGQRIEDIPFDCEEARWFFGMLIGSAVNGPRGKVSLFGDIAQQNHRIKVAAKSLHKIRHWKIIEGDYRDLPNEKATWFIDPPYFKGGHYYVHGNNKIDYAHLAEWCQSREGHVIVCENEGADWLPFKPLSKLVGVQFNTVECVWEKGEIKQPTLF